MTDIIEKMARAIELAKEIHELAEHMNDLLRSKLPGDAGGREQAQRAVLGLIESNAITLTEITDAMRKPTLSVSIDPITIQSAKGEAET